MCEVLGVSASGYYAWVGRPESRRCRANRELVVQIRLIHRRSRETYGSPRVTEELHDHGLSCGENRVAALMRRHGIRAQGKRKYRATTNSRHQLPVAPNILNRQFTVDRPNAVWVSDISVPQQAT